MPKKEGKESTGETLTQSLEQLQEIVGWFDAQESVKVESGLAKIKEGAVLIKALRGHLKEVENEFQELKKELATDEEA